MTSHLMEIVIFALSVTIYKIFTIEMFLTLTFRMDQANVNIITEIAHSICISYLMAIVKFALLASIYENEIFAKQ